ncbi:MAG TPA: contact-dependent growth inhibition system immunity protein, partial [Chitinophagaceae bacterium]|nr:contact-dependent growth inhibition system immunity protein [Chitinophagaceae bacterium]
MESLSNFLGKWPKEIPVQGQASSIQLRSYQLYAKRIGDYSTDDLRFMIGQEIGLDILVPI